MSRTTAAVVGFRRTHEKRPTLGIAGWPLRWKMAVVLTVPLLVAAGLGALRVQEGLEAAADFTTVADRVQMLPLLVDLDGDAAVVMGTLAQRAITASMIDNLDASIGEVERANTSARLDDSTASHLATALSGARALSAQAKQGGPPSTGALTEQLASIRSGLSSVVTAITTPIADPELVVETGRLEDLWAAQKLISAEGLSVVASTAILTGESDATLESESANFLANLRTESALLDQVAQRYPPGDPTIETLRKGVSDRTTLLQNATRRDSVDQALTGLKYSLFASVDDYSNAVATASAGLRDVVGAKSDAVRGSAWRDMAVVTTLLLAAILLAVAVARSLLEPLRRLRRDALQVAHTDLPAAVGRVKAGAAASTLEVDPIDVHTQEEIGQLARAIDDIHSQALLLAGEQAQLRLQMNNVFETLTRRSRSLIDLQLEMIEQLEFEERDPKRLDNLFRLDHLATRMRRNGDNLLILAGSDNRRSRPAPILLGDAVRASISEVEDYQRVQVGPISPVTLTGTAGRDLVHILAELLDNSLHFSPPDTAVMTTCARTIDGGVVIEIVDRGIGMSATDLHEVNDRVAAAAEVTPDTARRMGLFVVSELSKRHHITISFRRTLDRPRNAGITVSVHISGDVLTSAQTVEVQDSYGGRSPGSGQQPERTSPETRALTPTVEPVAVQRQRARQEPAPLAVDRVGAPASPVAGALPQRRPGATGITTASPGDAQARPPSVATSETSKTAEGHAPRHRLDSTRTASFFQPRVVAEETRDDGTAQTPIFAGIAPPWWTDPTKTDSDVPQQWITRADTGWSAARRSAQQAPEGVTRHGLPQRVPGQRLVPGGVDEPDRSSRRVRTPETVRARLTQHQSGVRAGRTGTSPRSGPRDR
jgi:signal transduction histidine kinase